MCKFADRRNSVDRSVELYGGPDRQMTRRDAEIALAGEGPFSLPRDDQRKPAYAPENLLQLTFALYRSMQRDEHRCRKVGRQGVEQRRKRFGAFGQRNVGDEATLADDAIPALADAAFPILEMLAARAHLGLFPHQKAQQLVAFFRIPSCMEPREVNLDIAFGQEDTHRGSHVAPFGVAGATA